MRQSDRNRIIIKLEAEWLLRINHTVGSLGVTGGCDRIPGIRFRRKDSREDIETNPGFH